MAHRLKQSRPSDMTSDNKRQMLIAGLMLLLATVLVYGSVVQNDFVSFDDKFHLHLNPHLNPLSWSGLWALWTAPFFGEYVPLTYTVFAVEAKLGGQPASPAEDTVFNPTVFHAGSLLLHLACVGLVFLLLRRLTHHTWGALCGAMLFSLHPLQVESVAWVSETRGLLAAFFSLLALWAYLNFAGMPGGLFSRNESRNEVANASASTARKRWGWYAAASVCLLAGLLSKPSAVVVPLLAGVLDVAFVRRDKRAVALSLAPWLILAGGFAVLTRSTQPDQVLTFVSPLWARPLIAGDALAFYLGKLVWPEWLGVHYNRSPEVMLAGHALYWTWLAPAAVLAGIFAVPRLRPYWPAAALFIAAVAPVLGLIPFGFQNYSTVADRYAYLALLGPAWGVAWMLSRSWTFARAGVVVGLLLPLAWWSHQQLLTWRSSYALYDRAIEVNPQSWLAHMNRGCLHRDAAQRALAQRDQGLASQSLRAAMIDLDKAIALHPRQNYPTAYMQRASVHWLQGQRDRAIADYDESIRLYPNNPMAYYNRGLARHELQDYQQAVNDYDRAIELQADNADAYNNRAVALQFLGRDREAIEDFSKSLALQPSSLESYISRAALYARRQQYDLAHDDLEMAKKLGGNPDPALVRQVQNALRQRGEQER